MFEPSIIFSICGMASSKRETFPDWRGIELLLAMYVIISALEEGSIRK